MKCARSAEGGDKDGLKRHGEDSRVAREWKATKWETMQANVSNGGEIGSKARE